MHIGCGLAFSAGFHCLQSAMRFVSSFGDVLSVANERLGNKQIMPLV